MANLFVRDFQACERADIEISKITLLVGDNDAGKSSIAHAFQSLVSGEIVPIDDVKKSELKDFVKAGADVATIRMVSGQCEVEHTYPKGNRSSKGHQPRGSRAALGMDNLALMDNKTRQLTMIEYLKSEPSKEELDAALTDLNVTPAEQLAIWADVQAIGWDGALRKVMDEGTKTKGRWEKLTGTNYNQVNAARWQPSMWFAALESATPEELEYKLKIAKENRDAQVAIGAVSDMERLALKAEADKLPMALADLEAAKLNVKEIEAVLAKAEAKRAAHKTPTSVVRPHPCPECGVALVVVNDGLAVYDGKQATPEELAKAQKKSAALYKEVEDLKKDRDGLISNQAVANTLANAARQCNERLEEIEKSKPPSEVPDFERLDQAVKTAEANLTALKELRESQAVIARIFQLAAVCKLLAPSGLRHKKLSKGLEELNATLVQLCTVANWKFVSVTPELELRYGAVKYWMASRSGKFKIKAALQCAFAKLDGSEVLCFDDNDELGTTKAGLNGLMSLIKFMGLPTIITRTINLERGEKYPDLKELGLGKTYRIEGGVAKEEGELISV
jgi:energy-coupling factor transporter ATP-binding protein EcfA2